MIQITSPLQRQPRIVINTSAESWVESFSYVKELGDLAQSKLSPHLPRTTDGGDSTPKIMGDPSPPSRVAKAASLKVQGHHQCSKSLFMFHLPPSLKILRFRPSQRRLLRRIRRGILQNCHLWHLRMFQVLPPLTFLLPCHRSIQLDCQVKNLVPNRLTFQVNIPVLIRV
jgi:hypothetical protein